MNRERGYYTTTSGVCVCMSVYVCECMCVSVCVHVCVYHPYIVTSLLIAYSTCSLLHMYMYIYMHNVTCMYTCTLHDVDTM